MADVMEQVAVRQKKQRLCDRGQNRIEPTLWTGHGHSPPDTYLPWLYVSLLFSEGTLAKICSVTSRKLPPHHACFARMVVPRATTANRIAMETAGVQKMNKSRLIQQNVVGQQVTCLDVFTPNLKVLAARLLLASLYF